MIQVKKLGEWEGKNKKISLFFKNSKFVLVIKHACGKIESIKTTSNSLAAIDSLVGMVRVG